MSVNVGRPVGVPWRGGTVQTGIFKAPVEGAVMLRELGFEGDGQADLEVHGGSERAAYVYSRDAYDWWEGELGHPVPSAEFGENLTVTGLGDATVRVGEVLRVGGALIAVTSPREPCFKLGIRVGDQRFPPRFRAAGRMGFYVRVLEEGPVAAGDPITRVEADPGAPTIADVHAAYVDHDVAPAELLRMAEWPALPDGWRRWFRRRFDERTAAAG